MIVTSNRHISFVLSFLFLFPAIFLSGCGNKRPKEVLSEKKMVRLMADMELAEAYANMSNQHSASGDYRLELGQSVLAAHGVTQEQLDTTLSWYGRNLDDYSELYAKVDKEILSRKKKLLNMTDEELEMQEGDILWKFGKNGLLSTLGNSDSWIFSVSDPELQKGDRLQWTMHIDTPTQINGVLGVEYEDGSSEASSNVFIGRNKLDLSFQTDTGKVVKRVYGTMRVKDNQNLPIFADSISIVRLPYDSMEYKMSRNVKRYGIPVVRKTSNVEKADTIETVEDDIDEVEEAPSADKPIMWHDNRLNSNNKPQIQNHSAPAKPQRLKPGKPVPARPERVKRVQPHEKGDVMNPSPKKRK